MQIKRISEDLFELKADGTLVKFNRGIEVGEIKINLPGEYEVGGVFVEAIDNLGETIYSIQAEGLNITYLGALKKTLTAEAIDTLENTDVLLIPTGDLGTIDLKTASKLIQKIDPKVVIPIFIQNEAEFLKSEGESAPRREKVYKFSASQLPNEEEREVIILE
jgi:L-ascorbate metabolism protein UlaG (beta-lactamase superfamily)